VNWFYSVQRLHLCPLWIKIVGLFDGWSIFRRLTGCYLHNSFVDNTCLGHTDTVTHTVIDIRSTTFSDSSALATHRFLYSLVEIFYSLKINLDVFFALATVLSVTQSLCATRSHVSWLVRSPCQCSVTHVNTLEKHHLVPIPMFVKLVGMQSSSLTSKRDLLQQLIHAN
jgi:hypothetical protein